MATIGIRIVYDGNDSLSGHMYVVFKDDAGRVETFGFYPKSRFDGMGGLGEVRIDDLEREQRIGPPGIDGVPNVARDFPVSPSDYQRALDYARDAVKQQGDLTKPWGFYGPITRSCVDFTWNVARQAGIRKDKWFEGYLIPRWNKGALDDAYYEFFRRPEFNREFRRGVDWRRPSDPLVFDLDGDGVELTGGEADILFDHNADGVRTGTQWVRADDGLLVRDLNGDSVIDSGRELFGDQTQLPSGQLASTGFAALAALDHNQDAVIDTRDAAFAELRVWRDTNQDGMPQAEELQSLGQLGITSINLPINLAQLAGTFVKSSIDGLTSTTQAVRNVNLASNGFFSEFINNPVVTETSSALPQMQGSGLVRDMREAMSLGSPQSSALVHSLQDFAAAPTAQSRQGLVSAVITAWANTSPMGDARARNPIPAHASSWYSNSPAQAIAAFATSQPSLYQQLAVLERFNGEGVIERYTRAINASYYDPAQARWLGYTYYTVSIEAQRLPFFQSAYDKLKASVYESLYLQTEGRDLMDHVKLIIDDKGPRLDFTGVDEIFSQRAAVDPAQASVELAEFIHFTQNTLSGSGWDGAVKLAELLDTASFTPAQVAAMQYLQLKFAADADVVLAGADSADILVGKNGNDTLAGNAGADVLLGGSGNDTLVGGQGSDQLVGGQGNDTLDGQWGDDTYFWGRGEGNDSISDTCADVNGQNTVVLRGINPQDIQVNLLAQDDYGAVRLIILDTGETLTLRISDANSWSSGNAAPVNVMFADGTQWDMNELVRQSLPLATDGNDTIVGTRLDDLPSRLNGGAGDDFIIGREGSDVMEGGTGNDILWGNAYATSWDQNGSQTSPVWVFQSSYLDSNTYVFGQGDGQDTIVDHDYSTTGHDDDVLRFKPGVSANDLVLAQRGHDLVVSIKGTTDQVIVKEFFYAIFNRAAGVAAESTVERFEFADGTRWNVAQIESEALKGTSKADDFVGSFGADSMGGGEGNDVLNGVGGNDALEGGAGDDALIGGNGDDILDGGSGNDCLDAGSGADMIRFGRGDGQDVLVADRSLDSYYNRYYNHQPRIAEGNNTIDLKAGVAPEDIKLTRVDTDLVVSIRGTNDRLTIKAFVDSLDGKTPLAPQFNLLGIRFADGSSWGPQEILERTLLGDAADETFHGFSGDDTFDGRGGNDQLVGNGGFDTYLFGRGDGKDRVINDLYLSADTLKFKEGISEQDVLVRRVNDSATFTIMDTGDSITFANAFNPYTGTQGIQAFAGVQFADGACWTREQVAQLAVRGTSGDDAIADVLEYKTTALSGGLGNDVLTGTRGTTVYTFSRGDGQDTIVENYGSSYDTISFGQGIVASDLVVALQGDDLIIRIAGSEDQITIKGDHGSNVEVFEVGGITLGHGEILSLIESEASEEILGSAGDDSLAGTAKRSTISGFEGKDILIGNAGDDSLDGGSDDDLLQGNGGLDALAGGDGNDVLDGGRDADRLNGGDGDDILYGDDGADDLVGGNGNDILEGGAGRDTLQGGSGSNIYRYQRGAELDTITLDPSASDIIELGVGISLADISVQLGYEYDYETGIDVITRLALGFGGNEALLLQTPYGSPFDPNFAQSLFLRLSDGSTLSYADMLALKDEGLTGTQSLYDVTGNVLGSQTDDYIDVYGGGPYIDGRDNNDFIRVSGAGGLVYGGLGDDEIGAYGSDAVVAGGAGDDWLGNVYYSTSTYVFNAGDGRDRVVNNYSSIALSFGGGIAVGDVRVWIDNSCGDLVLSVGAGQDEVRTAWYEADLLTPVYRPSLSVVQFVDANGVVQQYDLRQLLNSPECDPANIAVATSAESSLTFRDASAFLRTGAEPVLGGKAAIAYAQTGDLRGSYTIAANADLNNNNLLFGTPDADTLDGRSGDDAVAAGAGDDFVWGGEGDDYLDGQAGNDQVDGGNGDDILRGGDGDDRLIGGTGSNRSYGGLGYDSYIYNGGDGLLYIEDLEEGYVIPMLARLEDGGDGGYGGSSHENELVFGVGIAISDLSFSRSGGNLIVAVAGSADDVITLAGFDEYRLSGNRSIERFVFQTGNTLELSDVWNSPAISVVTSGDEFIEGTQLNDELRGGLQADVLWGGAGNDRLVGGVGDDAYLIDDGDGNDIVVDSASDSNLVVFTGSVTADEIRLTVEGGVSTVWFRGSSMVLEGWDGLTPDFSPISQFLFSDGNTLSMDELFNRSRGIVGTEMADMLNGAEGADEIYGLQGDDLMQGGAGSDTYYIESNSGKDTITDRSTVGQENTIVFADIDDPSAVRLTLDADGNMVVLLEDGNSVALTNFNRLTPQGDRTIEFFQFGFSGLVYTYDELLQLGFVIDGTPEGDLLRGTSLHDVVSGGAGNDSFERSIGEDDLFGGAGNDSYEYNIGDGVVSITDVADGNGGNVLRFGADISTENVQRKLRFIEYPDDPLSNRFLIVFDDSNEISISGFDRDNPAAGIHGIENFEFTDGTVMSWNQFLNNVFVVEGDDGDNTLQGTSRNDRLYGYAQSDTLTGNAGDDVLTGGAGDDSLEGGLGQDNYVFNLGDGQDRLLDGSQGNTIFFADGIPAESISVVHESGGFRVAYGTLGDSIFIESADGTSEPVNTIGNFELSDGSLMAFSSFINRAPVIGTLVGEQAGRVGDALMLGVNGDAFSDLDGESLHWAAQLEGDQPLPAWLQFDPATRSFSGVPPLGADGRYQIQIFASDPNGMAMSQVFALNVAANQAPELINDTTTAVEDDASAVVGNVLSNDTDVDDPDMLRVLSSGVFHGTWGSLTLATDGSYAYALDNANPGVQGLKAGAEMVDLFTYTASDGTNSVDARLLVTVQGSNDEPTLAAALDNQAATEDSEFSFLIPAGSFTDIDTDDILTYSAQLANGNSLPSWLVLDVASGLFSGTPVNGDVGTLSVFVTATDASGASASDVFDLNVSNTNDAPVAANDLGYAAEDGGPVTLTAAALLANDSDVDIGDSKHIFAVAATSAAGATVGLVNADIVYHPGSLFQSLGQGVTTTDIFTYTVADSAGASSTATVTMVITGANDAPVLALQTAAQTAIQGSAFTLTLPGTTFSDLDSGDTLSWSARQANGNPLPAWLDFNAATRTFSGTPGSNDAGALSLHVTATDLVGASMTDSFVLTVQTGVTQGQTFIGTSGNDVLNGTPYDDILDGRAGSDILNGGAGKDIVNGGTGLDRLSGEAGDDTLTFSADATWNGNFRAVHNGSPGNAGSGEQVSLSGGSRSYDLFNGGAGQDALVGSNGHDALFLDDPYSPPDGYTGPRIQQIELISMEAGNDVVDMTSRRYSYGDVVIDGGTGNDVLWASSGNDHLLGGDGNDQLDGGAGNDILDGGAGNDQIKGGAGNDILYGATGNDRLAGGLGNDLYLHGLNDGTDVIQEQGGQDVIRFAAGIGSNAVSVTRHHNDLVLMPGGQNCSVTVENWFDSGAERVERVEFFDGTVWDENALRARASHDSGGDSDGGGCDAGWGSNGNPRNNHGRDGYHSSDDLEEPRDKKKHERPDQLEDLADQINKRLAAAPRHDFGSLAAYLSRQGSTSTGPLTALQIARQWNTVRDSIQRLGQDDEAMRKGVQSERFGSDDDLVQGAMHWGYAGSVGQASAAGGMTSLNGLAEGFRRLS